jgi:single-strand DNA-binding protein
MYQRITLVGNLGRDPELRYLPNGTPTTSLSVATNNTYTNQQGEQVKETTWFRVSVFGKQAEACSQYLTKGRQVLVEGRLRPDAATGGPRLWSGNDGTMRASYDVTATTVRFIGSAAGAAGAGGQGGHAAQGAGAGEGSEMSEEDIPFE